MKNFLTTILLIYTSIFCYGQTRKIVYGAKDTAYYSIENNSIDGVPYLTYKLKKPLPDGKWMIYDSKDTTQLIDEVNYKDKKKNGVSVHYSYISQTNGLTLIYNKTEELYVNDIRINWFTTQYDSGFKIYTDFYSTVTPKKACKEKMSGNNFPILFRRDSAIIYKKEGYIYQKGSFNKCGRQEGIWKSWTVGGELEKWEVFNDGELIESHDGRQIKYYKKGELIKLSDNNGIKYYKNGELIRTIDKSDTKNYH